jgi:hypothetical protein
LSEDVRAKFTPTLEEVAKVDAEMKRQLANIVRKMILAKIEVTGENEVIWDKLIHLALILPAAISPNSEVANIVSRPVIEDRERKKAELMSIYRRVEAGLDQMSGKDLYNFIKRLKGRMALKKILMSLPPVQRQEYTVTMIEPAQYIVKNNLLPQQKSDNPIHEE